MGANCTLRSVATKVDSLPNKEIIISKREQLLRDSMFCFSFSIGHDDFLIRQNCPPWLTLVAVASMVVVYFYGLL